MTDRPILMSAPMVRSLLAGTKTQTRRVVKVPGRDPSANDPAKYAPIKPYTNGKGSWNFVLAETGHGTGDPFACPYGEPGDRLWVRETWMPDPPIDDSWASTEWNGCGRRIDGVPERFQHPRFCSYSADWLHGAIVWRPSIHMPRWASRITLEVTEVRVERLQDISESDCWAEGIPGAPPSGVYIDRVDEWVRWSDGVMRDNPKPAYRALWESINGPGSWDANPLVWVLTFRVAPGKDTP